MFTVNLHLMARAGLPLIKSWKIPWLFTDFWTILTDLKLVWWMIKTTENHCSKLLFLQTPLKLIIFNDAFLTVIPWLFTDFYELLRFSMTFYKIPWPFPDLEKILFFPDFSLTVATLRGKYLSYLWVLWMSVDPRKCTVLHSQANFRLKIMSAYGSDQSNV